MMVRCGGCIIWRNIAWWSSMFQDMRSVRVEYVVRTSSVTTEYIDHWNVLLLLVVRVRSVSTRNRWHGENDE